MTKNTSKFEDKQTTIKGAIIRFNPETMETSAEKFEIVTDYARSVNTATKLVREALNLDDSVMVSISELEQEKARQFKWLVPDLKAAFEIEHEQPQDVPETHTAIKVTLYDYSADVFGYLNHEPYGLHVFVDSVAHKATKTDAREIVRNYALNSDLFDSVVCVADCKRTESNVWFVVPTDEVEAYKKYED